MPDAVLALNAGSSSLKFALFEPHRVTLDAVFRGEIDCIGEHPRLLAKDSGGKTLVDRSWLDETARTQESLLGDLLDWIDHHLGSDRLLAVGHRVVHGGAEFTQPVRVSSSILAAIDALTPLAPLHQPRSLAPIRAIHRLRPGLAQIACFDTAFHCTMPAVATRLPIPFAYAEEGIRRYGFHGLSYEFISRRLREVAPRLAAGRVIAAHLGSGASLCALVHGASIDTTMGFTALDGLMMGTRTGAIDPGVLLYLLQQKNLSAHALEDLLYKKSGLLGVSGVSSDMRTLRASADPRAAQAIESFVYRAAREIAALTASLGGLDGLVFTGGIGEHDAPFRAAVCARLEWLGVIVADPTPAPGATRISTPDSPVEVHVVPTDEEATIARHVMDVITAAGAGC
jgi:acetate kinase